MTSLDIAGLLKEFGGWGLSAILCGALIKVYKDKEALNTGSIERLIAGLASATEAANATRAALNELRALIGTSAKAVDDHSHQIAILVEKIIHGFGNTSSALEGITRRLETLNGRDHRGRP